MQLQVASQSVARAALGRGLAPRQQGAGRAPRTVRAAAASPLMLGSPDVATKLDEIKPGKLWALRQDFPAPGPSSINLNCSVARLSGGDLLVYAPVAPTAEALEMLASLPGRIAHIIAPSLSPEHWIYVNSLAEAHPEATIWACPGLTEVKLPGLDAARITPGPRVKTIGPEMVEALQGEADVALFEGPGGLFKEVALFARDAGAVFGGDLFFGAFEEEGMPAAINRWIGDRVGIRKRLGCPVAFLQFMIKRDAGREWAEKISGWEFDTITGGHLSAGINKERYGTDGRDAFRECFKFVLP